MDAGRSGRFRSAEAPWTPAGAGNPKVGGAILPIHRVMDAAGHEQPPGPGRPVPSGTAKGDPLPRTDLLVEDDAVDLFADDLPAADPAERRAADLRFLAIAAVMVATAFFLAIAPSWRRRAHLIETHQQIVRELSTVRQSVAGVDRKIRRFEARDHYLIWRLVKDGLRIFEEGEHALDPEAEGPGQLEKR